MSWILMLTKSTTADWGLILLLVKMARFAQERILV